jgi:hypothetical protein
MQTHTSLICAAALCLSLLQTAFAQSDSSRQQSYNAALDRTVADLAKTAREASEKAYATNLLTDPVAFIDEFLKQKNIAADTKLAAAVKETFLKTESASGVVAQLKRDGFDLESEEAKSVFYHALADTPAPGFADYAADPNLSGFGFGIGISLTIDTGENDRIKSAEVDANGIIRVSEEQNKIARFVLETHYFFTPKNSFFKLVDGGQWGHGPFICIQPGDNIIDAVGAGWMIGFKRKPTPSGLGPEAFNLGVGVVVDPRVQVLGDGLNENEPLPPGDSIRYKNTSQMGIIVVFSVVF